MPVPELPVDLWKLVLQHVPLQQRLAACALVCHKLHAAAIAATDSIQTCLLYQREVNLFVGYLQQHGSHLTSIIVNEGEETDSWLVMKQFPSCQHLQQLILTGFDVNLNPSAGLPGALDSLTGLTRLELRECIFSLHRIQSGCKGGAAALSVLVNLQHLCLEHDAETGDYPIPDLKLASLQHLTHLELSYVDLDGLDLCQVSSLTKLRVLHINALCRVAGTAPDTFPFPPSLQHFYFSSLLCRGGLEGAMQLTSLVLTEGEVTSLSQGTEADDESGSYLLGVLNKFYHLHALCLSGLTIEWPPPSPVYRALVASSNLRSLTLGGYLPAGALAHIFSPAHALQLTKLELEVYRAPCFLDAGTVRALANCCPLLQELEMSVQAGPHLTALTQLPALTQLRLDVASDTDADIEVSLHCLSGLSRLQQLTFTCPVSQAPRCISGSTLLPLTGLRRLTKLHLCDSAPSAIAIFKTKAGPDQAPDVWLQLLEHCAAGGSCYPSIIRSLAQQLAEQQQQNAALQELVAKQGAQLQALQAQMQSCLQHLQPL